MQYLITIFGKAINVQTKLHNKLLVKYPNKTKQANAKKRMLELLNNI